MQEILEYMHLIFKIAWIDDTNNKDFIKLENS